MTTQALRGGRLIALVLAAACGGEDAGPPSRLVLERFPCLGTCPSYRLEIGADGAVEYEGIGYFNTLAAATDRPAGRRVRRAGARLAPETAAGLLTAFDRTLSNWWPNQYRGGRFTCPRRLYSTDSRTLVIVRERGAARDTLYGYYGCPYVPGRISRLGMHIDSVVGVERWLGPKPLPLQ